MRIIYDNAIDRATLTASSTAGVLSATRMQNDEKAEVWRSTGTSATITATWPTGERISGLGAAFTNQSPGVTWRVQLYTLPTDTTPVYDQTVFLNPGHPFSPDTFSYPLGVNSFAFGVSATGAAWIDQIVVARKMVITINDASNAAGYVEIGKLFAGRYFEPEESADRGAPLSVPDTTTQTRSDSGSLRRDAGPSYRKLSVSLSWLSPVDREQVFNIARGNGLVRSMFVSLYPENTDRVLEQAHQLWGCLVATPQMAAPNYLRYATTLDFEEI